MAWTDIKPLADKLIQQANERGIQLTSTSGVRTNKRQQELYDETVKAGRPGIGPSGHPVAKPGSSQHESGNAFDVSISDPKRWAEVGAIGKALGLRWGGDFTRPDPVHFDLGGGVGRDTLLGSASSDKPEATTTPAIDDRIAMLKGATTMPTTPTSPMLPAETPVPEDVATNTKDWYSFLTRPEIAGALLQFGSALTTPSWTPQSTGQQITSALGQAGASIGRNQLAQEKLAQEGAIARAQAEELSARAKDLRDKPLREAEGRAFTAGESALDREARVRLAATEVASREAIAREHNNLQIALAGARTQAEKDAAIAAFNNKIAEIKQHADEQIRVAEETGKSSNEFLKNITSALNNIFIPDDLKVELRKIQAALVSGMINKSPGIPGATPPPGTATPAPAPAAPEFPKIPDSVKNRADAVKFYGGLPEKYRTPEFAAHLRNLFPY